MKCACYVVGTSPGSTERINAISVLLTCFPLVSREYCNCAWLLVAERGSLRSPGAAHEARGGVKWGQSTQNRPHATWRAAQIISGFKGQVEQESHQRPTVVKYAARRPGAFNHVWTPSREQVTEAMGEQSRRQAHPRPDRATTSPASTTACTLSMQVLSFRPVDEKKRQAYQARDALIRTRRAGLAPDESPTADLYNTYIRHQSPNSQPGVGHVPVPNSQGQRPAASSGKGWLQPDR